MKIAFICIVIVAVTFGLLGPKAAYANPDVKDESIKVLINFKTKCNLQSLTREVTKENGLKFNVKCGNTTFYPDGLVVHCPIRDVDVSCKVMTKPKSFKFLNLIYGPMSERVREEEEKTQE